MQEMTEGQAKYAYSCIDHNLARRLDVPTGARPDVRQDAMARVLQLFGRYDSSKAGWKTYISNIARYAVLDAIQRMHADAMANAEELDADTLPDHTEELDVFTLPDGLTERQQAICTLLMDGHTLTQIMQALGISRARMDAERNAIRDAFKRYYRNGKSNGTPREVGYLRD